MSGAQMWPLNEGAIRLAQLGSPGKIRPRGRQFTLVAEVQTAALSVEEDTKAKRYRAHLAVMALVKDADGAVVERISNAYPLEGPLANAPALKRGKLLFKQQLWLQPGRYTVSMVVRDQLARRWSRWTTTGPRTSTDAVVAVVVTRQGRGWCRARA